MSSDDFSVTYGNNSPCTDQGRAKSFVDSSKSPVCTGAQSPPVLNSGKIRPRAIFPSSSKVQPELPHLAQDNVSEDPLPIMKDSGIHFDPVNNSDDSLVFQLDDHIKDFYCLYRDIRLLKDTLVNIKKDLPVPQIDFLSLPKVREAIKASKSFSSNKAVEINDYKLSKIQDQSSLAAYHFLHLWQNISHNEELSYEDIVKSLQQSLVLLGSVNANLNILRRECLATILSKQYASLDYDTSLKHGKYLFGKDLAEKVDKQNKEQRLMKKISVDSFMRGSCPNQTFYTWIRSNRGKGGGQKNTQTRSVRKVVLKRKGSQHPKQSNLPVKDLTQR